MRPVGAASAEPLDGSGRGKRRPHAPSCRRVSKTAGAGPRERAAERPHPARSCRPPRAPSYGICERPKDSFQAMSLDPSPFRLGHKRPSMNVRYVTSCWHRKPGKSAAGCTRGRVLPPQPPADRRLAPGDGRAARWRSNAVASMKQPRPPSEARRMQGMDK